MVQSALWQVETFGDTLHAAMTMQCNVWYLLLTDAYCGRKSEITCYLALGNSTSRNRILTQDLQLKFEIWYSCFHNLQYLCENNMQIC